MRPYTKVFLNTLAVALAFRWGLLTDVVTRLLQTLGTIYVWRTILSSANGEGPYTADGMTSYFITLALLSILFANGHFFRLYPLVMRGTLSAYLVRPYSFLGDCFATFAGSTTVGLVIVGVLSVILAVLGFQGFGQIGGLELALVIVNLMLFFLFGAVVSTLGFWLMEMWPIQPLHAGLMALVGGSIFPLDALPPALFAILQYTPFSLFGFVTARTLQGAFAPEMLVRFIAASACWSVLCFIGYLQLWQRGLRRYEAVNA